MKIRKRSLSSTFAIIIALALAVLAVPAHAQSFTALYSFSGGDSGANPLGGVIRDSAGNLYGTTAGGGANSWGLIFKIDSHGNETVLYNFTGAADGGEPAAGLVRDSAGNLYGTTDTGGNSACNTGPGCGVVFKLDTSGHYSVLYAFTGPTDGSNPDSPLILDTAGNLYSTTPNGGDPGCGCGTVFKLDPTGKHTILHAFTGLTDGHFPEGPLVRDAAGNLFGTTLRGGSVSGLGTVYKIDSSNNETVLHRFTAGSDGAFPITGLTVSGAFLYGTTESGGSSNKGTIFKLDKSGAETVVFNFPGGSGGAIPEGGLVRDRAGNLYGTTIQGGPAGVGTVFKLDPAGNQTILHNFTGQKDGRTPSDAMVLDNAGNLYGVAAAGEFGLGVVFEIAP